MRMNLLCVGLVVLAMACSDDSGDDRGSGGDGIDSAGGETLGTDGADDGPSRFDIEGGSADKGQAEDGTNDGCKKVDFLFVIDSSNSMATNQAELIASFPEFVMGIQSTLSDVESYHVGVVTSDAYQFNEAGCTEIGALVTQTGGKDSSMQTCGPYMGGTRYMTDLDDLPTAFSCAAQVGTGGANDEAMVQGGMRATAVDINGAGMCNEGFMRDDALLVLVFITDEDDPGTCILGNTDCMGSPGDPAMWHSTFVALKGGNPENVAVLTLVRGATPNVCGPPQGTEKDGLRMIEFTTLFGMNGFVGDICAASFGPFFNDAIGVIEGACGSFVPPQG